MKFLEKDIAIDEQLDFVKYYSKQTKEVLKTLDYEKLTYIQKILYDHIINVLKYVDVKHEGK